MLRRPAGYKYAEDELITSAGIARDEKEAILPIAPTFGRKGRWKPRRSTFLCRQTAALE